MEQGAALRRTLVWIVGLRAAAVTLLLGSAILVRVGRQGSSAPIDPLFALIALTYGLTAVYAATLRWADRRRWLVDVQFAADAVVVSAAVALSGGVLSVLTPLYVLAVLAAGAVQFRRGGLLVALLSLTLYAGIVVAQYSGALALVAGPAADVPLPPARTAVYTVSLGGLGFLAVALLTGYLAEGLRSAGQRLERASTEIADLQAFNQYVIDSLTGGLATTDLKGHVLTFNRTAELITGLPADAVRGRHIAEVLQLPDPFRESMDRVVEEGRFSRVEVQYHRDHDAPIDVGMTAAPLVTAAGRAGFIVTFQDLTAVKRLQRQVERQQRLAAIGELAARIAHEIRNPLASMSGSIQVLRDEIALSDEQARLMDIVLRESDRLNDTITDFLAYARPHRRAATRVDVGRVLQETARLLRHSPESSHAHTIAVDAAAPDLTIEADEAQVRQVVWNLATNGLRAMPNGGRLTLRAARAGDGDRLDLAVSDEGVGIPAERLESLFQPFQGTFANGTGLGLAVVQRIVSDNGGSVRVASTPGQGTTISVSLPVLDREALADEVAQAPPDEPLMSHVA